MAKPIVDTQKQNVTNTKNAGSSLANCDFVSVKYNKNRCSFIK